MAAAVKMCSHHDSIVGICDRVFCLYDQEEPIFLDCNLLWIILLWLVKCMVGHLWIYRGIKRTWMVENLHILLTITWEYVLTDVPQQG